MIPPLGNLLLALLAVLGAFLYPKIPSAPFTGDVFVATLQWLLTLIAGWNVKAAAQKSSLPTVSKFFKVK